MDVKIAIVVQLFFLVVFIYAMIGKVTKVNKWLLTISLVGILFIADKTKLLIWSIAAGVIWLIKYSKKQKNGRAV